MRLFLQHQSRYRYPRSASLGPHLLRLRPAQHAKAKIESYGLTVEQPCHLRWQQDPSGNHVARISFADGVRVDRLDVLVELAVDIRPVNPFDFFIDDRAETFPFVYPPEISRDLAPYLDETDPSYATGPRFAAFLAELPRGHRERRTVPLVVALNQAVNSRVRYVIREETGIWTPEETLAAGRGSCRDSAVLLIAVLRKLGLAARFVSGYLVQLTDEGMIPDAPKGVGRDVVDLHAWAEVYLPGGGWVGLDATSGLLCGEGHIPLACTAHPPYAAPMDGTSDVVASDISFSMTVGRLGHEPRPTTPYEEPVWRELVAAGERADARLTAAGITLTMGGEPTFNARDHAELPEWNTEALGKDKWQKGIALTCELQKRLLPGAALLHRAGKHYPGESLPRWALDLCGRADGTPVWSDVAADVGAAGPSLNDARRVADALAARLGLGSYLLHAYEDPWRFIADEANLPVGVDPLKADLDDSEDRRRLARVLGRGLGREAGFVLPLARTAGAWVSERWAFRRGHLFLIPGDSPIGLRLPLRSIGEGLPLKVVEEEVVPPDPRRVPAEDEPKQKAVHDGAASGPKPRPAEQAIPVPTPVAPTPPPPADPVRTAVSIEVRDGTLFVFVPPLASADDFFLLVAAVDAVRRDLRLDVLLEGYPPPSSPSLRRMSITPDPGVLEVNVFPSRSTPEYVALLETVFDAALHAGLHAEKYMVDGRMAGSGGGNHLTVGGPTPLQSPFLRRPDLLASLITFAQHHPSLSYMFTGLFVGPTSQAPRLDEARTDALYEAEIALGKAFATRIDPTPPPPWLSDMLFRHLLVDVSGNTHRAEICIDKLFAPEGPSGRQGLVELRAFEMPPHVRMAAAQMILLRSLIAAFAAEPYDHPLARHGQTLHDRFLLPHWMWRDFEDILAFLESSGLPLPADAYRPFVDLRCPLVGNLDAGDVRLEVRNAIEPWHVLGEELGTSGTSRYVDSSMERIEIIADGLLPDRHRVLVNGRALPLVATGKAGQYVGGVRFRAWAPPHSMHAFLGIHHPLRIDVLDLWGKRSLGACGYHVWHPEGRGYDAPPLTRFEAVARRAQRFTVEPPLPWPIAPLPAMAHRDQPYTLDLRLYPGDQPMPEAIKAATSGDTPNPPGTAGAS